MRVWASELPLSSRAMRGGSRRERAIGARVEIRGGVVAAVSVIVRLGVWVSVAVAVSVALILMEATKHWCVKGEGARLSVVPNPYTLCRVDLWNNGPFLSRALSQRTTKKGEGKN